MSTCPACGQSTKTPQAVWCAVCGEAIDPGEIAVSGLVYFHDHVRRERRVVFVIHSRCWDIDHLSLREEHCRDILHLGDGAISIGGLSS